VRRDRVCVISFFERGAHGDFHDLRNLDFGGNENRRTVMEPIMCPFCGGTNLFQEDDYSLELDFEYWTIHHWECLDCAQSFDKIEILPASNSFEAINNESTIH
jgi:hypothetical protein